MREKLVEAYLVKSVQSRKGLCLKWTSPQYSGVPDRVVILNGHVHFIELKAKTGRLSPLQKHFERAIQPYLSESVHYAVLTSIEEINNYLNKTGE